MANNKKGKSSKHIDHEEQKNSAMAGKPEMDQKKLNVSDVFLNELKGAFDNFSKIPESHRIDLYGKKEYIEQFREYFKNEHPSLLDKIDKKDLPLYVKALENKWFTVENITLHTSKLHEEFKNDDTEEHVMRQSLSDLQEFCDDNTNNIHSDTFKKFADTAWFNATTHKLSADGKLKTIDDLHLVRKKFLEKEDITLWETSAQHAERILTPNYNPTERVMVTVALTKIRKELKWKFKDDFDEKFGNPLKVDIFSPYQDLLNFKNERIQFLTDHPTEIDESLAKKLDSIIVTNGDIQKELLKSWKSFDDTKWFSEREQYFRRIFNKLVTRQLFDEIKKTDESIDHYLGAMVNTFNQFPPYVNEILKIYPFNDKFIAPLDPSFHADLQQIDDQILVLQNQFASGSDTERSQLRAKIKQLKQEKEYRRRQAYILFLETKAPSLADIFIQLVANKFDFSVLSSDKQQVLIDTLVKNTLQDTIKNKVPGLLSVTEEELTQFVHDLFDLKKMNLTIPTRHGPVPLTFLKKEFLSSAFKELPGINDLENLKNLPLNFVTQLTASNAAFFEESPIFTTIFTDFHARNGDLCFNDAYKVKIKKDGKTVEWYLSSYCPINEKYNDENYSGKELFLYSEPITAPNQERKLVTREWTDDGTPVIVKDEEQSQCDMEILDKKINLNGDALWALLFGYVLGKQGMEQVISPAKEKQLGDKFGKLDVYKEKEEWESEEAEPIDDKKESKEESEYDKFIKEWSQLKWYNFPEEQYKEDFGFTKGSRLFIPFGDSDVPPSQVGKSWFQMEITDVDKKKWTFTTKIHGGETSLGKYEWLKKEMPINPQSIATIKSIFWVDDIYRFPDPTSWSFDNHFDIFAASKISEWFEKVFQDIKYDWWNFSFIHGEEKDKKVEYFWRYEPKIWEDPESEAGKRSLYKIKHNSDNTFTLTGDFLDKDGKKVTYSRDMDYPTFLIFIKEKWLQPKSEKQADAIKKRQDVEDHETPKTIRWFSINNVLGFFKNWVSKIKDSIKKFDDERTEDLTDFMTDEGRLYNNIGKILSHTPFGRMTAGFEMTGAEYFLERDSRLRKKVEKRKKFYEDADFSMIYNMYIAPMIKWEIVIQPHYKAAAMLLAMINKGKWPYNRNPEFAAKGMRVNILMWPAHQQKYLVLREKLTRELQQWSSVYGSIRTDNKKNEILELEMKYIVHVMDARQLGSGDDTKYYFYGKYSKQFIDELEWSYTKFFSQSTVEEWVGKVKGSSFDFARAEFFRLLGDRPQQAVPFLKAMAIKATSPAQWKTFEMAVMTGMLSWVFLTMTMSETQWMIKNICRTRGFVPGIRVKDIYQQNKLQRMLEIFTGQKFGNDKDLKYDSNKFSYGDMSGWTKNFASKFPEWIQNENRLNEISDFFKLTGKNKNKETMLDVYANPKTSSEDKKLIKEFLDNSNEKNESLDGDVRDNPYAMSWSILTKSQSVVDQMMKFDNSGFAGKNGDEIQTMEWFFSDMKKEIPTHKLSSSEQVKFFLDKFLNRFEEKGFSGQQKTEFIKRLKYCQEHPNDPGVDTILYYSIVGQICSSFHRFHLPSQFEGALLSWKDFFKNNIHTILHKDIIVSSFGGLSYYEDYQRMKPQLESREVASSLLDKYDSQLYINSFPTKEQKEAARKHKQLIKRVDGPYINGSLYELADGLERNNVLTNRFKIFSQASTATKKESTTPVKPTWAKIKNPEVIEKVRRILEGKPLEDENPEEYMPSIVDDDPYYEY